MDKFTFGILLGCIVLINIAGALIQEEVKILRDKVTRIEATLGIK